MLILWALPDLNQRPADYESAATSRQNAAVWKQHRSRMIVPIHWLALERAVAARAGAGRRPRASRGTRAWGPELRTF